jgi:hypothetical protein
MRKKASVVRWTYEYARWRKLQALGGEAENLRTRVDELSRKTREQESVTEAIKRETTTFRALNQEHEKHIRVLKKAMQVRRRSET